MFFPHRNCTVPTIEPKGALFNSVVVSSNRLRSPRLTASHIRRDRSTLQQSTGVSYTCLYDFTTGVTLVFTTLPQVLHQSLRLYHRCYTRIYDFTTGITLVFTTIPQVLHSSLRFYHRCYTRLYDFTTCVTFVFSTLPHVLHPSL